MCECKHKHYECIVAWASGKKIQYKSHAKKEWKDVRCPTWTDVAEYRIKPEPKPDIVRYSGLEAWQIPDSSIRQRVNDTVEYTFDGETGILKSVKKV